MLLEQSLFHTLLESTVHDEKHYICYREQFFAPCTDANFSMLCANVQIIRLHIGMISMCESLDLPHWAVFVALHMPVSDDELERIIKQILEKAAPILEEAVSIPVFLRDELGVPAEWLHEAWVR